MNTSDKKTDDSKLATSDTVYVSPDVEARTRHFRSHVKYDFCVDVANAGELPSEAFFVRSNLSGGQDPPDKLDFTQDETLDAAALHSTDSYDGTLNLMCCILRGLYRGVLDTVGYIRAAAWRNLRPAQTDIAQYESAAYRAKR